MYRRPVPRSRLAGTLELALDLQRRAWLAARATPGLALLSLVLGFAVWLAVTDVENPTRTATFPAAITVEAVNIDRTLAVSNTLQRVEVTLSAPDDRWERLTSENLRAHVDLAGLEGREQIVPVQVDVRGIAGVRVAQVTPPTLLVNLEPLTTKRVPIAPVLRGSVPLGYEVTQSTSWNWRLWRTSASASSWSRASRLTSSCNSRSSMSDALRAHSRAAVPSSTSRMT